MVLKKTTLNCCTGGNFDVGHDEQKDVRLQQTILGITS